LAEVLDTSVTREVRKAKLGNYAPLFENYKKSTSIGLLDGAKNEMQQLKESALNDSFQVFLKTAIARCGQVDQSRDW